MPSLPARLCGCAAVLTFVAAPAAAQEKSKETVEVSGSRPAVQILSDRQSYSVEHDLQSAGGSLGDVLKNLPSVEVDVLGNVSLRGDPNVTVLIDGKRSALLAGNLGEALEQIPADSIDRIEVMTSPSAQYKAQGSGGIINIVSRKEPEPGSSGAVRVNLGNDGRYSLSTSGAAELAAVRLNAALGWRRDLRYRAGSDLRTTPGGAAAQTADSRSRRSILTAKLGAETELDARNSLAAAVDYNFRTSRLDSTEHNSLPQQAYDRFGFGPGRRHALQSSLEIVHAFAAKGEELKLEISQGYEWEYDRTDYRNLYPDASGSRDWQETRAGEVSTEAAASFVLPLAQGETFKTGYSYEGENNIYDNLAMLQDAGAWKIDGNFTSRFHMDRGVHAAYASYETALGKFNLLAGLRGEAVALATRLATTGETHHNVSTSLYPSLHLGYDLSGTQKLTLAYSRRSNLPNDDDLNPARSYRDAFNVEAGNPLLKAETTDAFEAGYRQTGETAEILATAFYRRTRNGFIEVSRLLPGGVLLTTRDNLARRCAAGLELSASGDLGSRLSFSASADTSYVEIDPGALSTGHKRAGWTLGGKAGFDFKLTPDDVLQFGINYAARQLQPQGQDLAVLTANAGFRHSFTPGLSAVLNLSNLFDSQKRKTILDTAGMHDVAVHRMPGRIVYLGLVYSFGGAEENGDVSAGED
jgi:outer membrane receptor protein involved in Fe transport